jgi:uncharacterized peroxidase-related enzyme
MNPNGRPHFLADAPHTPEVQALFDSDLADNGYVMNLTRLWAHEPPTLPALFELIDAMTATAGLGFRDRGVLVSATASTLGDSYCSLAWGGRLAESAGEAAATSVLKGDDRQLTRAERALVGWARKVVADPSATTVDDLAPLRATGLNDRQIFAITVYVALRVAFSTVNSALGARPDAAFATIVPDSVREAITFGRPILDDDVVD